MPGVNRASNKESPYWIPPAFGLLGVFVGGLLGALGTILLVVLRKEKPPLLDGGNGGQPVFKSIVDRNLISLDRESYSSTVDVSRMRTFSFLVCNEGPYPVVVQPEMSPDGLTWSSFGELSYVLDAGERQLFIPQYFLRYARIKFRNKVPGLFSVVTVWFQGQS